MSLDNLTVLNAMTSKMSWLEQNQKELASNIANADTPGYIPRELKKQDFKHLLESSTSAISLSGTNGATESPGMKTTNKSHMNTSGQTLNAAPRAKDAAQKETYETAPAGNAVILEEQMLKMSENYADHRLITNLYQKNIDMIKASTKTN